MKKSTAKTKKPATKKAVAKKSTKPKPAPETVLVLRTCQSDGTSYGGFKWPLQVGAVVTAPDWKPTRECGNGLHGWIWGSGDWSLKANGRDIVWLVLEVEKSSIVDLGAKVKFPTCKIVSVNQRWMDAMAVVRAANNAPTPDEIATGEYGHAAATGYSGHAAATGYSGHAAATGECGHAAATGYSGHAAATGEYGLAAATGYSGHAAATGECGHAAATGEYGHAAATGKYGLAAATGKYGSSFAGYYGKAKAGPDGCISILHWDGNRPRVVTGYVGEDGIESDSWYQVNSGKLVKVEF